MSFGIRCGGSWKSQNCGARPLVLIPGTSCTSPAALRISSGSRSSAHFVEQAWRNTWRNCATQQTATLPKSTSGDWSKSHGSPSTTCLEHANAIRTLVLGLRAGDLRSPQDFDSDARTMHEKPGDASRGARRVSPSELARRAARQEQVGRIGERIALEFELRRLKKVGIESANLVSG
jgi:hypothetical protein